MNLSPEPNPQPLDHLEPGARSPFREKGKRFFLVSGVALAVFILAIVFAGRLSFFQRWILLSVTGAITMLSLVMGLVYYRRKP